MKIKRNLFREQDTKRIGKKEKGLVLAIGLMLVLSIFALGAEMISAQGDDFDDAEEIEVPGQWSGTLDDDNEKDFYTFTLQPSEIITIEFTSYAGSEQRLRFYNPNRQQIFILGSRDAVMASDDYGLAYDTEVAYWFINVEKRFTGSNGDYTFSVSIDTQDDAGSGGDVPGTFEDAYEIQAGEHTGMLKDLDEIDMYKIELASSSIIDISFRSSAPSTQRLRLYNPNRGEVFRLESSDTVMDSDDYGLAYETETDHWYIGIEKRFGASDGEYTFTVSIYTQDDAGSGGDAPATFDDALEIDEGEHTGMLKDLDEKDMYKIELGPSSIIEIELRSHADNDQTLEFYNPNREQLFSFHSSSGSAYSRNYILANETETDHWFINVEKRYGNSDGEYTLTVSVDTQDDAGSGGDAPGTFDDALEIEEGEYEGILGNLDTADMYKIYVEAGSLIELEFSSESPSLYWGEHQLRLYSPERSQLLSITSSEGSINRDEHTVTFDMESGYRYLKVDSAYGDWGYHSAAEYRFVVSIESLETGFIPEDYYLDVYPTSGEAPLTVTIYAEVENVGDERGEVSVTINGDVVNTFNVDPYSEAERTFTRMFTEPGEYTVVFGDQSVIVTVTEGDVEEPDDPYSDVVTDPEGDVIRRVGPTEYDWEYVESPEIDITRIEISESGGVVTVSLTVKGTITDHPDIFYYVYLKDDSNGDFNIWYNNGDCQMSAYIEYDKGGFGNVFEPAVSGVGTDTLSFSFTREQIGNPDVLKISWASAHHDEDDENPKVDMAGPDAIYPGDDNGDDNGDNDYYDDIDEEFFERLFARGMWCIAIAILIPLVVIVVIIVLVVKVISSDDEKGKQQYKQPPPQGTTPPSQDKDVSEETPPPNEDGDGDR